MRIDVKDVCRSFVGVATVERAVSEWAGIKTEPVAESPAPADEYHAKKADQGKLNYDLLPPEAYLLRLSAEQLDGVVRVLEFGARKYSAHSWQNVPDAPSRYRAAARRHVQAIVRGEALDPESGLPHADHFCCNLIFVFALSSRGLV
jgi:hypothetical protein